MFTVIGNTDFKDKYLDVTKELKLEADHLMAENIRLLRLLETQL